MSLTPKGGPTRASQGRASEPEEKKRSPLDEAGDGRHLDAERDARWWRYDGDKLHTHLMNEVRRLRSRQRPRREMYRFYAELYGVNEVMGLGLTNYDPAGVGYVAPTLPFNVVRRGVNTLLNKVGKNRPLPMVLTERGDYKQNKRARGLTNFLAGAFNLLKAHEVGKEALRDALVFGTGIIWPSHQKGDELPTLDRVMPWEFFVDVADARYGNPKQFYVLRWVDRTVLKELYPEAKAAIEGASGASDFIDDLPDYEEEGDLVLLVCAWRCATRDGGEPGRWAVAIDGVTLATGEYPDYKPPFVFIRYNTPVIGFYGDSLAGEMSGFQYEVNYTTETLRMAHRVAPTGIWLTDDNTGIPDSYWDNEVGVVIKRRPGSQVEYISPPAANEQTYGWLERCSEGALRWSGISEMSANAEKPKGIQAARALQTLTDVEADNFALLERAYEQLYLDIADRLIDQFKAMASESDGELKILVPQKRSLLRVNWADVDLERDATVMQTFPVNLLGRTPASRLQSVNDLFNAGVIDRGLYLKLLDAPDIDAETDLDAAVRTLVDEQLELMLDAEDVSAPGAYQRPVPFSDLVYALRRAAQQVCLATLQKYPEPNIDLLRQYIDECKLMLDTGNEQPTAPTGPQPPAGPPGAPGMPGPGGAPMGQIGVAPPPVAPPPPVIGGPMQ
jgi:hypothetical protein